MRLLYIEIIWMGSAHPLAGELAEDGGDVAGVLGHDFPDIFLHTVRNAARHARHDLLELQQRQRRVPQSLHQGVHPLFELQPGTSNPLVSELNLLCGRFISH